MKRPAVGVAFLARGAHDDSRHAFERFVSSYARYSAGTDHRLYIMFKDFRNAAHLRATEQTFSSLDYVPLTIGGASCDIAAYKIAAHAMAEERICFLNTKSQILCGDWLAKLSRQLDRPGVGLVGNTGSFESHTSNGAYAGFPLFPNVHIRTNGFLMQRRLFCEIAQPFVLASKMEGLLFESGWNSLTRQVVGRGLDVRVVGRDGEAYEPVRWPRSGTYRSSTNANTLIADDDYRRLPLLEESKRRRIVFEAWGHYAEEPPQRELELWLRSYRGRSHGLDRPHGRMAPLWKVTPFVRCVLSGWLRQSRIA